MNITENTLESLLNTKISNNNSIDEVVHTLQHIFFENYQNKIFLPRETETLYFKLMIVKYGILDITFDLDTKDDNNIVRFMLIASNAGPDFFEKHPNINPENFIKNWKKSFKKLIPLDFIIKDSCLTNHKAVWDEKYFYI